MGRLAASPPRLAWRIVTISELRAGTAHANPLMLDVPGWPGHLARQHVGIRLTAQDGYQAQRCYSIALPPESEQIELTIERIGDGEVSSCLVDDAQPVARTERFGPTGG